MPDLLEPKVPESVTPPQNLPTDAEKKPVPSRHFLAWLALGGVLAVVAMAALLLVVIVPGLRPNGNVGPAAVEIGRVLIPEAHAGDAFSMYADKADAAGLASDSGFVLKSVVPVSVKDIEQHLAIVPAVDFQVREESAGTYRITPSRLEPSTVYQVSLPSTVVQADGTESKRDFSWAFQTKNDFRVISSIPADGSSNVPVNTGFDFKMTQNSWENATASLQIVPAVKGRFETRGRTLSFIPSQPLSYGTRYEVTLKKGFKEAGSDLALANDYRIRFETESKNANGQSALQQPLPMYGEFYEIVPGAELELQVYDYDKRYASTTIDITGYALSDVQARTLLEKRLRVPIWAPVEKNRFAAYKETAGTQAFQAEARLMQPEAYGASSLRLPKFSNRGFFALKIQPKGGVESWVFVQVTNVASYLVADKDTLLVWSVNPSTRRSWAGLSVRGPDGSATTDDQGLARLSVPVFLKATSSDVLAEQPFALIELGANEDKAFNVVRSQSYSPFFTPGQSGRASDVASYVFVDRPLYHPADELQFFGLAQERASKKGVGALEVRLQKQVLLYDFGTGAAKVYQEQTLNTDGAGFFRGSMHWSDLSNGFYVLSVMQNGELITSRSFEVREFVKPSYGIEVTPDAERVYAGEDIKGTIRAIFYDGTPVPRVKLQLVARGNYGNEQTQNLTTDENGYLAFRVPSKKQSCAQDSTFCPSSEFVTLDVRPTEGEEGEIVGSANVEVFGSVLLIDTQIETTGTTAHITFETHYADFSKTDARGEAWPSRRLAGAVIGQYWEQIPDGTYYDFDQHKTFPRYRYEKRLDPPVAIALTTDVSGKVRYSFHMKAGRDYEVTVMGTDDQAREARARAMVAIGWYDRTGVYASSAYHDDMPHLTFDPRNDVSEFALDEKVVVKYKIGDQPLDVTQTPGVLYLVASRGLKEASVLPSSSYELTFKEDYVPTAEIRAVTFYRGHFKPDSLSAIFKRAAKALVIEAKPDQASYAPGATVNVKVSVKTKAGEPARNAKVAFGAVDKALLAASGSSFDEDPLSALYGYVSSGILYQFFSHQTEGSGQDMFGGGGGGGGAEMGGFGLADMKASIRRTFKDTAAFDVVETDSDGNATLSFKAPDNLTTWRVQVVALSADLRAGSSKTEAVVTRPVFVDVVAPPRLLASDKPILKLRAFGTGLLEKSAVTYAVDAPSLGLNNASVTGTAGVVTYLSLKSLPVGRHTVTVGVQGSSSQDAIERTVDIVSSNFLKDEYVRVDAVPGARLPELGASEADVVITSKGRSGLLSQIRELSYDASSPRVDRKIAAMIASKLLKDEFQIDETGDDVNQNISLYQSEDGGLRLLPYASTDLGLSAELAATDAEHFDKILLASYFWNALDTNAPSREVQIEALSGLASLKEPVLARLQAIAEQKDLNWHEELSVARGLAAAGDQERARVILEHLLLKGEERDAVMQLAVSDKKEDRYEATADAAALAARLAHPKAEALRTFVETNWTNDAFPILAKIRYIQAVFPRLPAQEVRVSWTLNGSKEETAFLKDEPAKSLTLTAEEARAFEVTNVTGPAEITLIKRTPGRPTNVPEVSVNRTYKSERPLDQLQEGDVVRITLTPTWQKNAQDGCYAVRDHLPGGWEAVVAWNLYADKIRWYPTNVSHGEASFVACKDAGIPQSITYLARIVARGSYTAEAPQIQHLQFPSVASTGVDQVITVR